ncbi:MAG: hypothetical protein M3Z66_00940, partial [Chloroflexota bacterium]|nr:hypothetical protein [Chloroflexota bacterium]
MKLLLVLLSGVVALTLAPATSPAAVPGAMAQVRSNGPLVSSQLPGSSGTLVAIRRGQWALFLTLLNRSGALANDTVGFHSVITGADGQALQLGSLRAGDRILVSGRQVRQDISQRATTLHGIVSLVSNEPDGAMALQVAHSQDVLLDTDPHTRYTDRSHETSTLSQIQEGDEVQVRGAYDRTLG